MNGKDCKTWQESAACAQHDAELWHVEGKDADSIYTRKAAVRICGDCPVRTPCLTYAMKFEAQGADHRYGIWGGMTATQRENLARKGTS